MICNLCPRSCGAERTETAGLGYCRMPAAPVLARAALHHWEEPPISGVRGSGTVFFSGCSLGCLFCQNEKISHQDFGRAVTPARLREVCQALIDRGAHNLNFVNPTHYTHVLAALLSDWRPPVPVVFNTGGYDRVDTLRGLEGKVDVYLPDLKYLDSGAARRYSAAPGYPEIAQAAIREMVRQTGPCRFDDNGLLLSGTIIRYLILPGQVNQAKAAMDWVSPGGTCPPARSWTAACAPGRCGRLRSTWRIWDWQASPRSGPPPGRSTPRPLIFPEYERGLTRCVRPLC